MYAILEELAKLRSQTEHLARENEDMQRKLVDKEAEIAQIAQALHLVREKLSVQQPLVEPIHPNQDHPVAGEEFLGLLRSLAVKHSLGAFTDVSPGTHQTNVSSGNAAAMSPSREPAFGGMKTNNDPKANSTSSENADDLETDGELDKDSISDICPAAPRYRRPPSAPLARAETPLGSLYSSVSSLRTVDEVQFRSGLSSLDAQIAKLRLSLSSQ
ncbi:unnamed protein product [Dibothriocephalus latus]|uniref:Uncharacterized protein n=1 Tax=Dibothriocephalus latus TaxID=60516 RepID=A0A3P7LLB0_DIBLA|nr:unnamed protein product [Dibothriocephalus latus]